MLSCYLDDSDNDQGPVLVLAGYLGSPDDFRQFEIEASELFQEFDIETLHAMKFHHKRGQFKNWDKAKRDQFVLKLYRIVYSCNLLGVCSSVNKSMFFKKKKEIAGLSNLSPLGFVFAKLVWGVTHKLNIAHKLPLSFIVESGNNNNGNLVKYFNWMVKEYPDTPTQLGAISFVSKESCKSIQLADFLAFYGRKAAQQWDRDGYPTTFPDTDYLGVMMENVPHHFERSYDKEFTHRPSEALLLPGFMMLPIKGNFKA